MVKQSWLTGWVVGCLGLVGLLPAGSCAQSPIAPANDQPNSTLPLPVAEPSLAAETGEEGEQAAIEQAIFEQINQVRQQQGLEPLTLHSALQQQARLHSQRMAEESVISHDGFDDRLAQIAQSLPYQQAAENVAFNQGYADPATEAVNGWLNSPGHRQNMLGDYDLTGIGVVKTAAGKYYFTQIFIRSSS